MGTLVNLKGMSRGDLESFFSSIGEKPFRGRQLYKWMYAKGVSSFDEMTDLSKTLREKLRGLAYIPSLTLMDRRVSHNKDTEKFLFCLTDGNLIESVLMRYKEQKKGRCTVCISSQVGCSAGCAFCASGKLGLVRNLKSWEIADQVIQIKNIIRENGERIHNVVIMGIGEPLMNYENVVRAIHLISDGDGIAVSKRRIALSTVGIPPMMRRLADENLGIKFAVSLHAPKDEIRSQIMPMNRKYPIAEVLDACRYYQRVTGKRITFEYALIEGLNDSLEMADELAEILSGIQSMINIIPLNPIDEFPYNRPSEKGCKAFAKRLERHGCKVTFRTERGVGIDAACGQLRLETIKKKVPC